ncbi:MAG: PucC family protein [Nitratireductor sp.]
MHTSQLGWRRVPFIWRGTMLQFGGLAIMPFALLVLGVDRARQPMRRCGSVILVAGTAFPARRRPAHGADSWPGAGYRPCSPEDQPNVVGLMYVMLLLGMIVSALLFGWALENFSPGRLVQVVQASALATIVLNVLALWKMEARNRKAQGCEEQEQGFADPEQVHQRRQGTCRLVVVARERSALAWRTCCSNSYGGQVLDLSVSDTTKLTAMLALGSLIGFALASRVLARGFDPIMAARRGTGHSGLQPLLCLAAPLSLPLLYVAGTTLVGFGAGLFGHGTLTATMRLAPREQIGLALGTWGAVQASAAGIGVAGSVPSRRHPFLPIGSLYGSATPYIAVYLIEIGFLVAALAVIIPLVRFKSAGKVVGGLSASTIGKSRPEAEPARRWVALTKSVPAHQIRRRVHCW